MKSTDIKNHKTSISQTHNLEVSGIFPTVRGSPFGQQISSPGWSTLLLQRLTLRRRSLFLVFGYFICYALFYTNCHYSNIAEPAPLCREASLFCFTCLPKPNT